MRKYYIVGESTLDVILQPDMSANASPGGIFLKTACRLSREGYPVSFLSELGLDPIGRLISGELTDAGVDISDCDHFDCGQSPVRVTLGNRLQRYDCWPQHDGFDIAWPRIETEDVVLFGGYYSLDPRIRKPLLSFLSYASEAGATMVYIPSVADMRINRITKVMPQVFENLEMTSLLVSLPKDLPILYDTSDSARAYRDQVSYYCNSMVAIEGTPDEAHAVSFGDAPKLPNRTMTVIDTLINILISL